METIQFLTQGIQCHTILKRKLHLFTFIIFCFIVSNTFGESFSDKLLYKRIEQAFENSKIDNSLKITEYFTNQFNDKIKTFKNNNIANSLIATALSNTGSSSQPDCVANQSTIEMLCLFGDKNKQSSPNKRINQQIRLILKRFEEQNDFRIQEDYQMARVDKRIAIDASKIVKSFFSRWFCQIVKTVISQEEKLEHTEVQSSVALLTTIVTDIKHMISSQSSSPLTEMMRIVLKSMQTALNNLNELEKSIGKTHSRSKNELYNFRINVLKSLVNLVS